MSGGEPDASEFHQRPGLFASLPCCFPDSWGTVVVRSQGVTHDPPEALPPM